ncbi:hypothetical protein [Acinetobacter sp.]|uniref:hypothetical protein n=1 Tax=Acinetobacter sp. TaxID=472 RepID=UPI0031D836CA
MYKIILLTCLLVLLIIYFVFYKQKVDNYFKSNGIYKKIQNILDSTLFNLIAIILAGLNAYIMLCLGSDEKAAWFKQTFGTSGQYLLDNGGAFVFISIFIAGLYPMFRTFILLKCNDNNYEKKYNNLLKQHDIALKILEQLEKVVVGKRQRFAKASSDFLSTPQPPRHKTVFNRITQPDEQIRLLIESLHDCVNSIYPTEYIKVALAEVKNGVLDNWVCHSPYDTKPRTTIDQLKDPNSTFSKAIAMKKIIIVADTQIEIQKPPNTDIMYIQGNTNPAESWSQVCVPIHSINSNETIFIISIAIKRANVIAPDNEKFLEWLFKFFISRLALEHSLKELKERIS